jgi:hypothetical protein
MKDLKDTIELQSDIENDKKAWNAPTLNELRVKETEYASSVGADGGGVPFSASG